MFGVFLHIYTTIVITPHIINSNFSTCYTKFVIKFPTLSPKCFCFKVALSESGFKASVHIVVMVFVFESSPREG